MKDIIYLTVLDAFEKNANKDNVETYSTILNNIKIFDEDIIENEEKLEQTLLMMINGNHKLTGNKFTDAIVGKYDKFNLLDYLIDYLFFRYQKNESFSGLDIYKCQKENYKNIERIIFEDYNLLKNPFMFGQTLFFKGILHDEFINNPRQFTTKEKQIVLGEKEEIAYANLMSDDHFKVKELLQMEETPTWYLKGSLEYDKNLKMNVIEVTRIIYDNLN